MIAQPLSGYYFKIHNKMFCKNENNTQHEEPTLNFTISGGSIQKTFLNYSRSLHSLGHVISATTYY